MSDDMFRMPEFPTDAPQPQQSPAPEPVQPVSQIPPVQPMQQPAQIPQIPPVQPMQQPAQIPQIPRIPRIPRQYPDDLQRKMEHFAPDTIRMLSLPQISPHEAETCRHRLEKPWYRRLIFLNVFLILFTILLVFASYDDYRKQVSEFQSAVLTDLVAGNQDDDESADTEEDTDKAEAPDYEKFAEEIPLGFKMLGYGLALLIFGYLGLYSLNAQVRSRSVKVTERNFPEVYALIHSFSDRLGIRAPDAYIVSESGVLNAFSAFLFRRQYIQINAEVFEVGYREHKDINALAFIIAHEVAHIYYGHATLHYHLWIWFSQSFPLFGAIASRTREYSCDRLAQRLTNYDGVASMFMLIMDRHVYQMVDVQDYLDNAAREGGFFLWLVNLVSTHPIMPKRIRALANWNGSGELY